MYFDKVLRQSGLFDQLEQMGIQDGDIVSMYDLELSISAESLDIFWTVPLAPLSDRDLTSEGIPFLSHGHAAVSQTGICST